MYNICNVYNVCNVCNVLRRGRLEALQLPRLVVPKRVARQDLGAALHRQLDEALALRDHDLLDAAVTIGHLRDPADHEVHHVVRVRPTLEHAVQVGLVDGAVATHHHEAPEKWDVLEKCDARADDVHALLVKVLEAKVARAAKHGVREGSENICLLL